MLEIEKIIEHLKTNLHKQIDSCFQDIVFGINHPVENDGSENPEPTTTEILIKKLDLQPMPNGDEWGKLKSWVKNTRASQQKVTEFLITKNFCITAEQEAELERIRK